MSDSKSATAYRTISEVADGLDVPQHVLRFWETKFPAVKPLKRGGNRRYYRPEDIELLRVIHRLLYIDGYTIRGVQKLLKERGAKALVAGARPDAAPLASPGVIEAAPVAVPAPSPTPVAQAATQAAARPAPVLDDFPDSLFAMAGPTPTSPAISGPATSGPSGGALLAELYALRDTLRAGLEA